MIALLQLLLSPYQRVARDNISGDITHLGPTLHNTNLALAAGYLAIGRWRLGIC